MLIVLLHELPRRARNRAELRRTLTLAAGDTPVSGMKVVVVVASARMATATLVRYGRWW